MSSTKTKNTFGNRKAMYSPDAIVAEAKDLLAYAAGPRGWDDTRDAWLARAARVVGIDFSRAKNIWYGKSRRLEAAEFLNLRHAVEQLRQRNASNLELSADIDRKLAQLGGKSTHRDKRVALSQSSADR